jgi:hypothetical protein
LRGLRTLSHQDLDRTEVLRRKRTHDNR